MDLQLKGKTAIVTGASRGIGLAIARGLAREGVRVVAAARDASPELSELVRAFDLQTVLLDLTDPAAPGQVVDRALGAFGAIDILVNDVGALRPRLDGMASVTDDEWAWSFDVNFFAAVRMTRSVLPHLIERSTIRRRKPRSETSPRRSQKKWRERAFA